MRWLGRWQIQIIKGVYTIHKDDQITYEQFRLVWEKLFKWKSNQKKKIK